MEVLYVKFNRYPEIDIRQIKPADKSNVIVSKDGEVRTVEEDKRLFPFILKNDVIVTIFLKSGSKFSFKISEKYKYNGADIPKQIWSLVGSQYNPEFLQPSMIHDFMLENKENLIKNLTIEQYRSLTTEVFHSLLLQNGVKPLKASIMSSCVDIFQKYFNKGH